MTLIQKGSYRRRNNTSVRLDPLEESLVRTIHRKVGGPAKLSTYDNPADVRDVVIRTLADEQRTVADSTRIHRGDLTPLERRVVRTVTNRGAAVRSRMRQRKELQRLRDEVARKDAILCQLAAMVAACSRHADMVNPVIPNAAQVSSDIVPRSALDVLEGNPASSAMTSDVEESFHSSEHSGSWHAVAPPNSYASSPIDPLLGFGAGSGFLPDLNTSLDLHGFPNVIDPLS